MSKPKTLQGIFQERTFDANAIRSTVVLLPLISLALAGCSDIAAPAPRAPAQPKLTGPASLATVRQPRGKIVHGPINLSKLWGASKKQIKNALRGHKLVERDSIPGDDPDPMAAGGEIRVYDLGGTTEFTARFNSQGFATLVSVVNQGGGLGFTFNGWKEAFRKYGLPDCGDPARTAPAGYYWGPPHNRTGGFEIEMFANENGEVWQVQARSPDDFFPE